MNNEFRIKNMIADDILYQVEQQTKENLKIYYANILQENKQLKERIDNVNKYIDDLLEKDIDKTILEAIKFMLGDKENE